MERYVGENVPGFVTLGGGVHFCQAVRCSLELGYGTMAYLISAAEQGCSQARIRAILQGWAFGLRSPRRPQPLTATLEPRPCLRVGAALASDSRSGPHRWVTVGDAIGDLAAQGLRNGDADLARAYTLSPADITPRQAHLRGGATQLLNMVAVPLTPLNMYRIRFIRPGSADTWCVSAAPSAPPRSHARDRRRLRALIDSGEAPNTVPGSSQPLLQTWLMNATSPLAYPSVLCRLQSHEQMPTILGHLSPNDKSGRVLHMTDDRNAAIRECARGQGFLDTFVFRGSVEEMQHIVGNAIPPPLARALGYELRRAEGWL